ncbi:MAG: GMC family oxidoreductase N-terminal domain-containing protein [Alphaproteobacteria bacterium]
MEYDYVIVGGGSAGCVLANRLSAQTSKTVALIEAGPDTPPENVPDEIYSASFLPDYFQPTRYWTKLEAYMDPLGNRSPEELAATATPRRYEQGRVMGGGSSVNGQVAIRGLPADYDEWASLGADGWSFNEVLPYFRRLERDIDFDGPFHGKDGPIAIRRTFPKDWGGLSLAFRDAVVARGIPYVDDCHAYFKDSCFPFTKNNVYTRRVSAAVGYLDDVTRMRKNLHILAESVVEALVFEGRRAVGVRLRRGGTTQTVKGREIIVSTGAIHSPAMLMRAGIGPGDHLKDRGIAVLADRPGVGSNLQDHPLVGFGLHIKPAARLSPTLKNNFMLHMRWSSKHEGCTPTDMKLSVSNRFSWSKMGEQLATIQFGPNKAYSKGFVRLKTTNPEDEPLVTFNLLSDPRDLARVKEAVRFVDDILKQSPMKEMYTFAWPGIYADAVRNLQPQTAWNTLVTNVAALLLDMGGPARRFVLNIAVHPRYSLEGILADEKLMEEWIRAGVQGDWHACGTCRMGRKDDRMAVVDSAGRVHGVEGLRVVDASVMPSVPCANTNISTIMIGEKMADSILAA